MTVFVRFDGLAETLGTLKAMPEELERQTILRLSQAAYDEAQRGAGRHNKTGALVQSLFNRAIPRGREVGHDAQRAPQAVFVNFGTRPHVIRPDKKKALRWAGGGRFFFAKQVNHPGYRGDPYLFNAATSALTQFAAIVDGSFKDATR